MSIVHSSFFEWVSPNTYLQSILPAEKRCLVPRFSRTFCLYQELISLKQGCRLSCRYCAWQWYDSERENDMIFWVFRAADSSGVQRVCDWFWSRSAIIGSHMTTSPPLSLTMSPIPRWRELELSFHYDLYFCFHICKSGNICMFVGLKCQESNCSEKRRFKVLFHESGAGHTHHHPVYPETL